MKEYPVKLILILLIIIPASMAAQLQKVSGITSMIEAVDKEIAANEPIKIKFILKNTSDQKLNVLKWFTPFEGFNGSIFSITKDGEPVKYLGRVVKRGAPGPDEYIGIDAGAELSVEVDLTAAYNIYAIGDYTVEFNSRLLDFGADTPEVRAEQALFKPKLLQSNAVIFKLTEERPRPLKKAATVRTETADKTPVFNNCTQSQITILNQALKDAREYAVGTQLGLVALEVDQRPDSPRYTKWFGTYTASRYDLVTNHFDKIYKALANETISFHCDCNENYYAYVYPDEPYHIYLCNAFWNAPATGTDSRMGTIIHETSHFYVVTGTDDHAYGQSSCEALADSDPDKAVDNADSHEYIAENTPEEPFCASGMEHIITALTLIVVLFSVLWYISIRRGKLYSDIGN